MAPTVSGRRPCGRSRSSLRSATGPLLTIDRNPMPRGSFPRPAIRACCSISLRAVSVCGHSSLQVKAGFQIRSVFGVIEKVSTLTLEPPAKVLLAGVLRQVGLSTR